MHSITVLRLAVLLHYTTYDAADRDPARHPFCSALRLGRRTFGGVEVGIQRYLRRFLQVPPSAHLDGSGTDHISLTQPPYSASPRTTAASAPSNLSIPIPITFSIPIPTFSIPILGTYPAPTAAAVTPTTPTEDER
ncbi:hypothetical protein D9615_003087 [Tricholomella constricta]|uniref:Secreted protein n=1 Tax=Tricholomella constricta TaxID=117010 RepID=A0A8H5HIJ1_9AGAR|nr:hypothetical protein D9615_003087 [Tricholomella constricta]